MINKRTQKRKRYNTNVINYRANKRTRYSFDVVRKRAVKRKAYRCNKEENRAIKRAKYEINKNCILEKKRKNYILHRKRELNRLRNFYICHSESKKICNKKYYENHKKYIRIRQKMKFSNKISEKYKQMYIKANKIGFLQSVEIYIKALLKNTEGTTMTEKRIRAEQIIKWCIHARDNYITVLKNTLSLLRKKAIISLARITECLADVNNYGEILCGLCRHTCSTESYFYETTYKYITFNEPFVMNENGQVVNILPITKKYKKKVIWKCGFLCKGNDVSIMDRFKQFLILISNCSVLRNIPRFLKSIGTCTLKHSYKLGHSQACYIDHKLCKSKILALHFLSPHYPKVRNLQRLTYRLKQYYEKLIKLDEALYFGDIETLELVMKITRDKCMFTNVDDKEILSLNEDKIMSKYFKAFTLITKRSMDVPQFPCLSCEKLCFRKNTTDITKFRKPLSGKQWNKLANYLNINMKNTCYICRYCLTYFRNDTLPPTCILNNLQVDKVPDIIFTLNEYEKMLIQRAKAFQTVQKMGTVSKKKLPSSYLQKKVKGRTFHLPLPTEETIKKICAPTDVINCNHELYILVRSIPTKSKVIWENLVDVKKVYEVLTWLKKHNPLYAEIRLPDSHRNLLTEKLNDTEYQLNDNVQNVALLTQIVDSESHYEQFTIYPMYEKRVNESSTALYQMLKVQNVPIDNRHKSLDLLCFPDLYPFGKNGQHENRPIHLPDNEFIKSRLLSKHSQFRLNIQYVFYLLNDANIRQLNGGIYHKLNVTNPREKFTARRFLEEMSTDKLEGNINTIFSRLRNTAQYWRKPRCDLSCMIHHYGPATWFLTLSPSEWLWSHMIEYLREINPEMSKKSANELIASDPVSVSRYVDNKFHAVLEFICSSDHPIGEVTHYFWRREYQSRGTQHFHLLIWIKDAPVIGESSNEEIAQFLLKYVTCKLPDKNISPTLYRRVNTHQRHIHNNYCLRTKKGKKGIKRVCRFGFPRPITNTLILKDIISSIAGRRSLKAKSRLYDLPRKENEKNINDYNPTILTAWEGNMDIQFIGEKSTLLNWYCTKYTTKYETSDANDTFQEINSTKSLRSRLWNFAMRNLSNRECGALEACDTLLGISLYGTDPYTTIRWLDVNQVRCRKVKPRKEVESLNSDSTDIFCKSIIDDYYPARPQELELMNLYNFAKWYDITKKKPINNFYVLKGSGKYPCYIKKRQREYLINHYKYNVEMQPEKYFYSLLLLFKPWRDLSELKQEHATYAEAFISIQSQLPEALRYHEKIVNNQKCLNDIKEAIEKQINQMSQEQNKDSNEENFIAFEAGNAMHEFRNVLDKAKDININDLISGLNDDQRRVFDTVINTINSSSKCLRHYVSGEGGTGKSHLIKAIKYWTQETTKKDVAVIAPTGIAAFNIDGLTIHRFLQLPVEHGHTPKYRQLSDAVLKTLRDELKNISLIIIDEVSMVSNITLMYIHLRLTEIFNTFDDDDGWFGKKHILLFGDLLQLPPVREESAFINISKDKAEKCLGSLGAVNLWNDLFTYDELRINMRQKDDNNYRELLSRIRLGIVINADIEKLNNRKINFTLTSCDGKLNELCDCITKLPSDTVCLLPTCYLCNVLNAAMLERIPSENVSLLARDIIDCPTYLKKKVQKAIDTNEEDSTKTAGLSKEIIVKIGAKIMLRRNIDVTLGLVNGTIATITKISRDTIDNRDVNVLTITLPNGKEYNIERVSVKFEIMDKAYVIRKQFPLSLSYGITIHKSQGLSLSSAVIDVGNLIFSSGQTYTALSRLTSIDGLHLINYDPASVKVNELAIVEYNRLRALYRKDVESIDAKKNRHDKIKDEIWAIPISVDQDIYADSEIVDNALLMIKGFTNVDNVSCYANTTLQCLIHCNIIRKLLLKYNEATDTISLLINDYMSNKDKLSSINIRQFVGNPFTLDTQQDAAEFLMALCEKITILKDAIEHDLSTTIHCTKCNYTITKTQKNLVISLSIPPHLTQSVDLEHIIKYNFSRWSSVDGTCETCKEKSSLIIKYDIYSTKQIIVLQLALFFHTNNKEISKITKCNIKAVPTTKISIATNSYDVSSAIFHHGNDLYKGHFTNMLRDRKAKKSKWIHINDEIISHKPWPRNSKDAYIFFLEQC